MMNNFFPPQMVNNIKGAATEAIGAMKGLGEMATDAETVMTLVSAYKSGNLMPAILKLSQTNPQLKQALGMLQGKNNDQLIQMAQNMAAERGMTINDVITGLNLNNK